ncbi:MAG: helix-turn-helix domain-containing protein [Dermatophilaceae bacterium]
MNVVHSQMEADDRALQVLWGVAEPRARGPRARRSVPEVAAAAVSLADEAGLEAVTLAAVAGRLGLTTTALYRYVDTKESLLEILLDAALGGPPDELTGATWQERVRVWTHALTRRYARHPWLARIQPAGQPRHPSLYAWLDALVTTVAHEPGIDGMRLGLLLDALVRAFAGLRAPAAAPPAWLGPALAARHPALAGQLGRDWSDIDAEFDAALDVVLRGVDAQARAAREPGVGSS